MTSTRSPNLNEFLTQEKIVNDNKQEINAALSKMFEEAINEINKRSPHSPDYIIIYRQGGNEIRNKILYVSEGDNFTEILKLYREKYKENKNFNFQNTKLYYICCNLKSDLKFFETDNRNVAKAYFNPKSGLIVDDNVTQKNKYEFYLQPQYVNQGTATPCHYQIMYYDKGPNEENDLKIETLEKLSFYLCYYFWTWSGSIRLPYLLKMSNTAMTFYKKILDNGESYYYFKKPTFI
jgi:aubergine-like protein